VRHFDYISNIKFAYGLWLTNLFDCILQLRVSSQHSRHQIRLLHTRNMLLSGTIFLKVRNGTSYWHCFMKQKIQNKNLLLKICWIMNFELNYTVNKGAGWWFSHMKHNTAFLFCTVRFTFCQNVLKLSSSPLCHSFTQALFFYKWVTTTLNFISLSNVCVPPLEVRCWHAQETKEA
jgi:hypothetical protein